MGGVEFDIRLTTLGRLPLKVTARSREFADAAIETLLVEPEGVPRETVANAVLRRKRGWSSPWRRRLAPSPVPAGPTWR